MASSLYISALIAKRLAKFIQSSLNTPYECLSVWLDKLLGFTAYVLHFVSNSKPLSSRKSGPLSAQELNKSKLAWIGDCQQQSFSKRFTSKSANRLPLVFQLRLFLDNSHFIRCGGRKDPQCLGY